MRFLVDGPSIPDELLTARDEGRVIFFCGAGISRARANLPDFFELAQKVVKTLGVAPGDPPEKIIAEARELEARVGIGGLISADRVFGLLERDFLVKDIAAAVAQALKPGCEVDLSAHRIMLDLAMGPNKKIRLVTTNFDLLFEACDSRASSWQPPQLPDLRRHGDLEGIIHMHGRVMMTTAARMGTVLSCRAPSSDVHIFLTVGQLNSCAQSWRDTLLSLSDTPQMTRRSNICWKRSVAVWLQIIKCSRFSLAQ